MVLSNLFGRYKLLLLLLLLLLSSSSSFSSSSSCNLSKRLPCFGHVKRERDEWVANQREHEGSEGLKKGEWMNGVRWSMTNHGLAEAYGQLGRGVYGETEFWLKENHRIVESPWVNE